MLMSELLLPSTEIDVLYSVAAVIVLSLATVKPRTYKVSLSQWTENVAVDVENNLNARFDVASVS